MYLPIVYPLQFDVNKEYFFSFRYGNIRTLGRNGRMHVHDGMVKWQCRYIQSIIIEALKKPRSCHWSAHSVFVCKHWPHAVAAP